MIFDGIIFYGFKYLDSNECTKCQNENVKLCYICLNCLLSTDHLSFGEIINSGLFTIGTARNSCQSDNDYLDFLFVFNFSWLAINFCFWKTDHFCSASNYWIKRSLALLIQHSMVSGKTALAVLHFRPSSQGLLAVYSLTLKV